MGKKHASQYANFGWLRNFWHISIRLLNSENQEISSLNLNEKKKKRIWKSARDFLIADIISTELKSYAKIPDYLYLKSS